MVLNLFITKLFGTTQNLSSFTLSLMIINLIGAKVHICEGAPVHNHQNLKEVQL